MTVSRTGLPCTVVVCVSMTGLGVAGGAGAVVVVWQLPRKPRMHCRLASFAALRPGSASVPPRPDGLTLFDACGPVGRGRRSCLENERRAQKGTLTMSTRTDAREWKEGRKEEGSGRFFYAASSVTGIGGVLPS